MSEVRILTLRNNKLACRVRGSGPPVVFIQGVNTHGDGWNRQVEALADHFTCVSFDNRGLGGSDRGNEPITVVSVADDTLALMDAGGANCINPACLHGLQRCRRC